MKIIKIGAIWCPTCLIMRTVWEEIVNLYPQIIIEDHDIDLEPQLKELYHLVEYPTYVFTDDQNQEIERLSGDVSKQKLIITINKYL